MRNFNLFDHCIEELQHGLSTCHARASSPTRAYPAQRIENEALNDQQQAHIAGLMRVNHAGEVAAQGLYRGQALTARKAAVSSSMKLAAEEENDHLNWCQRRLEELGHSRSLLDGCWYWGSFSLGALAGIAGDKWSLGFVKETETQVCAHLDRHLQALPNEDKRSQAIIQTMRADEARHAQNAGKEGAAELAKPIKWAMHLVSKVMTVSAYRV